jgi:hypothetical protein
VLHCKETFMDLKMSCHSLLLKILSQSVTIATGGPCNLNMLSMKTCATKWDVYGYDKAIKWKYFVNLSTTTSITLLFSDFGRPSMKSMEMKVHAKSRIGSGASSPG